MVPKNIHTFLKDGFLVWTLPPHWNFQFSFIHSLKNLGYWNPLLPRTSNDDPWSGYGNFPEPQNASNILHPNLTFAVQSSETDTKTSADLEKAHHLTRPEWFLNSLITLQVILSKIYNQGQSKTLWNIFETVTAKSVISPHIHNPSPCMWWRRCSDVNCKVSLIKLMNLMGPPPTLLGTVKFSKSSVGGKNMDFVIGKM